LKNRFTLTNHFSGLLKTAAVKGTSLLNRLMKNPHLVPGTLNLCSYKGKRKYLKKL